MPKRKSYETQKKVQVLRDLLRADKTIEEVCIKHSIAKSTAHKWKKTFDQNAHALFEITTRTKKTKKEDSPEYLKSIIGGLTVENDILKKP